MQSAGRIPQENIMKIALPSHALITAFAATLALTGCGDGDTGTTDTNATNATNATDATDATDATEATTDDGTDTDTETTAGPACAVDICATYGAAVPQVSSGIVDAAAVDSQFMDDFAPLVAMGDAAVQEFKDSLTNFITDAYGCTDGAYTGLTMEAAHAGMAITQEEYDAFIVLIAGVLSDAGVPDEDITNCFAPPLVDPTFANTIIGQ